jgi:hypothetical protein
MRVIILEGPDSSGKSTLAKELENVGYRIVPFGVPPAEAQQTEETIFRFFFNELYKAGESSERVAFDRLHLSESIYGGWMRGGTLMSDCNEMLIERYLNAIDGQLVMCLPPRRTALKNWLTKNVHGDEYVKSANIWENIYEEYSTLFFNQQRNNNWMWYDYTRHHAGMFAEALVKIQGRPLPHGMVGSQTPRFIFCGEQAAGEPDLPFMTPNNSSGWLFNVVHEAGYKERDIAFINARTLTGEAHDMPQQVLDMNPTFIALGKTAHQWLSGLSHEELEHPQFFKRFHKNERWDYINRLAEIRRNAP